jgi:hypothetical protein
MMLDVAKYFEVACNTLDKNEYEVLEVPLLGQPVRKLERTISQSMMTEKWLDSFLLISIFLFWCVA